MSSLDQYGYVSPGSTRSLLADLTPPLYHGSEIALELLQHGAELWSENTDFRWKWEVKHGKTSTTLITKSERFTCNVPLVPTLEIKCTLQNNGADTDTAVKGSYSCLPGAYSSYWAGGNAERAAVELVYDFKSYIEDAAKKTGPNGISARFIAGVLNIEIRNRPRKDRQEEIEVVGEEIAELTLERHRRNFFDRFNANIFIHQSFGVGQMKMSTLAMALGMIPMIEHDRNNNEPTVELIKKSFMKLTTNQMLHLWRIIRWPKSHIDGVAKALTSLKNRPRRYPHLNRATFLNDPRAMAIIATEYNRGATTTAEPAAAPTWYGEEVATHCLTPGAHPLIYNNFSHV